MPLQNRVTPYGEILALPERGTLMGNRGRLHDFDRQLGRRRWERKAWVCCRLSWKGIHRTVMSPTSYTELFFLDEATALAAGHRPCNDCRREDLVRFCTAVGRARSETGGLPRVTAIDEALHAERVMADRSKRTHVARLGDLPDGVLFTTAPQSDAAWLLWRAAVHRWSPSGYTRESGVDPAAEVLALTPPTTVAAIKVGYVPSVHPSVKG